ncbi:MAG: monovalent cation/H(+) antiporter subunit G [Austwickia sp.]|nr:monovalent cation/H(+) antiporter subunit G [Actinomycetota bacterium]MCB1253448.1 monovalent cation/H(+) antiporter subunit G [Austwickia sp.]
MSWDAVADGAALVAVLLGALMNLTTGIGLVRLPDLFSRQHAGAKPQVLGVLLTLLGVGLALRDRSATVMLLVVAAFQLLTVPVSAHMVTRAGYRGYVENPDADPEP